MLFLLLKHNKWLLSPYFLYIYIYTSTRALVLMYYMELTLLHALGRYRKQGEGIWKKFGCHLLQIFLPLGRIRMPWEVSRYSYMVSGCIFWYPDTQHVFAEGVSECSFSHPDALYRYPDIPWQYPNTLPSNNQKP